MVGGDSYAEPPRRGTAYERMKHAIVTGDLGPGQPLVEVALAEWLQVSRTPVREALTRLEQDGLVVRADRGLLVRARSREEILDIYETRIVLEAMAAWVAASRRSALDLMEMKRLARQLEDLPSGHDAQLAAENLAFHRSVRRASHNQSLDDLLARLDLHVARYPATTLSQPGRWQQANEEHSAIVEAVARGDSQQAHRLTTEHFARARELRLALWAAGED